MARAGGRRELQRELEQGRAAELPGLAQKIAARRALARAAVVERGTRRVGVSRYLGVGPDPKIRRRKFTRARLASPDPKYPRKRGRSAFCISFIVGFRIGASYGGNAPA